MTQYVSYESGLYAIDDEVYITDRNNEAHIPMGDALVDVNPDWDIDRAGSKGRVDITAHRDVLKPNMWIAPYRTVTPEVGEVVRYQRGHFKLGRPGAVFDGTVDDDGNPAHHQSATGTDIVDDLAAVRLAETFYTPAGGHVMTDVKALIQMATVGQIGPNLLTNGGFESGGTNWIGAWSGGPAGSSGQSGRIAGFDDVVEGQYFWLTTFPANAAVGHLVRRRQSVPIPPGTRHLFASGVGKPLGAAKMSLTLRLYSSTGTVLSTLTSPTSMSVYNQWRRHTLFTDVPANAATAEIEIQNIYATSGPAWVESYGWDDIQLRAVTSLPLPDERINLPISDAVATTRIQTTVGKSIGYDAINADRLNAIGHHALYTTLDGSLTTTPLRDLGRATPKRTYGAGDLRLVDVVEVHPGGTDIPNHFPAIKEHFEDASMSLYAEAFNLNAKDPYSVTNTGTVISAPPIMSPDAVDEAALLALAEAARDRHSTMENLTFTVLDDSGLAVHDVIEITDPAMPEAMGKWAIEEIMPDGPVMRIGARRAIGGGQ